MPSYHTLMIVCETCPEKVIVPAMIEPDGQVGIVRGRKRRDGSEEMFEEMDGWVVYCSWLVAVPDLR